MAIAGIAVRLAGSSGVEGPGGVPPTGLAVDQEISSNSSIRYTWTDAVTSGKTLLNIQVYFGTTTTPSTLYSTVSPGVEQVDITTGFSVGDVGYCRLKAAYTDGSVSNFTSSVGLAICQPQDLSGTGDDGTNNFSASSTGSPDEHRLYFGSSSGTYLSFQDSDDSSASVSVPASSEETQYAVMVGIKNGVESAYSNEASSTANDIEAPDAPTLSSANAVGSTVTLSFSNPGDSDHTYTRIYRRVNSGSYTKIAEDVKENITSPYTDEDLPSGTYDYYMTAGDDRGASASDANWSSASTVRQVVVGAPVAPSIGSITTSPSTVVAGDSPQITVPVTPGDGNVQSVQIFQGAIDDESSPLTEADTGSPYTISVSEPLNQPDPIDIWVKIITDDANSPYSFDGGSMTVNPIGTTTLVAESDGQDPDSITLSWSAVTGQNTVYDLQIQESGGSWNNLIDSVTSTASTSYVIPVSTLSDSTDYDWRVRAKNGDVTGLWSSTDTFTTGTSS